MGASHLTTTDLDTLPELQTLSDRKRSLFFPRVSCNVKVLIALLEERLPEETGKASKLQYELRRAFDGGGRRRKLAFVVQNTDVMSGILR